MDMREGMCNKCRYFIKVDARQEYCRVSVGFLSNQANRRNSFPRFARRVSLFL